VVRLLVTSERVLKLHGTSHGKSSGYGLAPPVRSRSPSQAQAASLPVFNLPVSISRAGLRYFFFVSLSSACHGACWTCQPPTRCLVSLPPAPVAAVSSDSSPVWANAPELLTPEQPDLVSRLVIYGLMSAGALPPGRPTFGCTH